MSAILLPWQRIATAKSACLGCVKTVQMLRQGCALSSLVPCPSTSTTHCKRKLKHQQSLDVPLVRSRRYLHLSKRLFLDKAGRDDVGKVHLLSDDPYSNPIEALQPFIQIPVIPKEDAGFKPSRDEVIQGTDFFEPHNRKDEPFKFLGSWPNPHIMPQWGLPEVAFIGRSNVGKSSLLAAMFSQIRELNVRTSKHPGHTKLMNVFNVKNKFHLVDMPGYGFNMPAHFETSVEAYIKSRRNVMTFILFDGAVGVTNSDRTYFKKYADLNLPLAMVLTKSDTAHRGKLLRNLSSVLKFRDESQAFSCYPQPFVVSAKTGEGVAFLQSFIAHITGNLAIKS